jgi:hypothetical protein
LIVATPLAIGALLWMLSLNRSPQSIFFNDSVEQIDFGKRPDTWQLPAADIAALQVTQCVLEIGTATVQAETGSSMRVDLTGSKNLQIESHDWLDVSVATPTLARDVGLTWTLRPRGTSPITIVLFAESAIMAGAAALHWSGAQVAGPMVARTGLVLTCKPSDKIAPSLTLVTQPQHPLLELGPEMTVERPQLYAPRGQIAIGNTLAPLGAGKLVIEGQMLLKPFRWTPGTSRIFGATVSGRSDNATMDGEQLVPSTLAGFSKHPGWTAFAAVWVVVLGAFLAKLVEIALVP